MTTKTQATALVAIADSAAAVGRVETRGANAIADAVKAYTAAGTESDAMKRAFLAGYMAGSLGLSGKDRVQAAETILDKKGHAAKVKADARRTPKQESAYTAARKALSRVRKAAGVAASDTRGGDTSESKNKRAPQTGSNEPDEKSKAKGEAATMVPAMASHKAMAAFLLNLVNKNDFAMTGPEGKELGRAVAAYVAKHCEPDH